jgi:hypothetical protein
MRTLLIALALVAGCTESAGDQQLPIGAPCKPPSGSSCTANAGCCGTGKFFCATLDHPGGYCKKDCKSDADCPTGSVCAGDSSLGECHKSCNAAADCRTAEGYICKPHASEASHDFCDAPEPTPDGGSTD